MITSTDYYRTCMLNEYTKKMSELESKLKTFTYKDKIKIKISSFNDEYDENVKKDALNRLKDDYFNNKCLNKDCTLFDLCIRKDINKFKQVFIESNTKTVLETLYSYLRRVPNELANKNKQVLISDDIILYYFKYYINVYFCYDFASILLENYSDCYDIDKLIFLEILINDLLYVLEKNLN